MEQYKCGELYLNLTDLNNASISGEIVNITITNKKGNVIVKNDLKGKSKLNLDLKKGNYAVNIA